MSTFVKNQVAIIKTESDTRAKADAARNALKKHYGRKSWATVRADLLPVFAKTYGVELVDGAGKALGTLVLDKEAKAYEACRKALGTTLTFICGSKSNGKSDVQYTRAQLSAAKKYLALFGSAAEAKKAIDELSK